MMVNYRSLDYNCCKLTLDSRWCDLGQIVEWCDEVQQATRLYLYISLSVQIFRLQTRIHRNFGSNHCLLSSSMLLRLTNIMLRSNLSYIVINRCYCIVCAFNMLNNVQNKRSVNFIDIVQFYFTNNTTISISVFRVKAVLIYEVSGFINDIFIK